MSRGPSSPRPSPWFGAPQAGETATETAEEPLLAAPDRSTEVLVVGASGFLGRHLLPRLLGRGHRVRAGCRSGAPAGGRAQRNLEWLPVDITSGSGLDGAVRGCEVVVHLAGGRPGEGERARRAEVDGTRNLVEAAERADVRRIVYVSVLGSKAAVGPLAARKREAERCVREGGPAHVILRPSLVVGPDDHVVSVLARALRRGPLFVAAGRPDEGVVQPAAIEDVAEALCQAVERADVEGATHELAGPDVLTPTQVIGAVARRLSLARRVVRLPRWSGRRLAALADRTGLSAPTAVSALRAVALPEAVEGAAALRRVFRLEPLPFAVALDDYL